MKTVDLPFNTDQMQRCPDCDTDVWLWQWKDHRTLASRADACPVLNGFEELTTPAVHIVTH